MTSDIGVCVSVSRSSSEQNRLHVDKEVVATSASVTGLRPVHTTGTPPTLSATQQIRATQVQHRVAEMEGDSGCRHGAIGC